ncbi:MAG: hypothetical protein ACYTGH_20105 [Planctomycetota bacterium]|jgi:hypothetical protein
MGIGDQTCHNHPDRKAIGVCVITRKAICAECSTRYEGVNYSKEGLARLKAQRAKEAGKGSRARSLLALLCGCLAPGCLYLLYQFYLLNATAMIDLAQLEFLP